jgi:hypothetical protein
MIFNSKKQFNKYANYFRVVKTTTISFEKQVHIPEMTDIENFQGYLKGMEKYYQKKKYFAHLKREYYNNRPTVPLTVTRVEIVARFEPEDAFRPDGRTRLQEYREKLSKKIAEIDSLLG